MWSAKLDFNVFEFLTTNFFFFFFTKLGDSKPWSGKGTHQCHRKAVVCCRSFHRMEQGQCNTVSLDSPAPAAWPRESVHRGSYAPQWVSEGMAGTGQGDTPVGSSGLGIPASWRKRHLRLNGLIHANHLKLNYSLSSLGHWLINYESKAKRKTRTEMETDFPHGLWQEKYPDPSKLSWSVPHATSLCTTPQ